MAALATSGVALAGALLREPGHSTRAARPQEAPTTTAAPTTAPPTTAPPPSTAPPAPPALQQPPPANLPPPPGGSVGIGSRGPEIQAYQQRMADLHFDPGPVDGVFDQQTAYAVQALQKLGGTAPTGRITDGDVFHLAVFHYDQPLQANGEPDHTEVDVTRQVLTLYENYQVRLITTTSTGSGENYCYDSPREHPTAHICEDATTPSGRFSFREFRSGWDKSPLGQLYNPYYFNKGIAVHGYPEVPGHPASHGCVRIPIHISEYFHTLVHQGDPVYVFGGQPAHVTSVTPIGGGPAPTAPEPIPTAPPAPAPGSPPSPPSS